MKKVVIDGKLHLQNCIDGDSRIYINASPSAVLSVAADGTYSVMKYAKVVVNIGGTFPAVDSALVGSAII